jgi:hypothetical protein
MGVACCESLSTWECDAPPARGVGVGGVELSRVLPRPGSRGKKDGERKIASHSPRDRSTPPPPPPARAERRAVTWPALTAWDTYTGWGRWFCPRFGRFQRGQINVSPFFISNPRTPFWLGLNSSDHFFTFFQYSPCLKFSTSLTPIIIPIIGLVSNYLLPYLIFHQES